MKTKVLVFLGFFLVLAIQAQNQQKRKYIDSLIVATSSMPDDTLKVARLGTIYEQLMFRNPELSFEYAKKEHALATKLGYDKGIGGSQLHFADYYKDRGNLDSARHYFTKSLERFQKINHTKGILFVNHSLASFEKSIGNYDKALAYGYQNIEMYKNRPGGSSHLGTTFNLVGAEFELIGGIHLELGNYSLALTETLKALKFFEEKKDTIRKGDALMQIGTIEYLLGNFESAVKHSKEAYDIYDMYEDLQYKSYSANSVGESLLELNRPSDAQPYFEEALEISRTIKNKEIEGNSLVNLGSMFLALKQYQKAGIYLSDGLAIHEELSYKKSISIDLNELAKAALGAKKPTEAIEYLDRSVEISEEIGLKDNLSEAYALRSTAYKGLNNYQLALSDHEGYKVVNDSIFNETKSKQIEELRTIYETEKKEQQIALQENEIGLLEEKAKVGRLQKVLLGGGLGLSLLVFGFGFYGLRQKMKRNRVEKEKVDAELAFKKKELTTHALHLAKKNEVLEGLKQKAQELKSTETSKNGYQQLIRTINFDLQDDNNWENFARYFEEVHQDFNGNVKRKFPEVTANELRLLALLKMNLSSKEIANILNISLEGIKKARYRLRKKLDITTEDSLQDLVLSL